MVYQMKFYDYTEIQNNLLPYGSLMGFRAFAMGPIIEFLFVGGFKMRPQDAFT